MFSLIRQVAFYSILGKPLIMYSGILTLLSFATTATLGYLIFKGKIKISFLWHPRLAATSLILAIIHALMGLSIYFK